MELSYSCISTVWVMWLTGTMTFQTITQNPSFTVRLHCAKNSVLLNSSWMLLLKSSSHEPPFSPPNNLSKWALQYLFPSWNITILNCNSSYLVLYFILFFDTNVYNEYWLTFYYQLLEPGNDSSGTTIGSKKSIEYNTLSS